MIKRVGIYGYFAIIASFLILFWLGMTLVIVQNLGRINNALVGCEGIDYYYSGEDFFLDVEMIKENHSGIEMLITSPKKLYESGGDCDAVSNAIYCLSQKYPNIECKFYNYWLFDEVEGMKAHIGNKCGSGLDWYVVS